jgi:hypothetical protein
VPRDPSISASPSEIWSAPPKVRPLKGTPMAMGDTSAAAAAAGSQPYLGIANCLLLLRGANSAVQVACTATCIMF